MSLSLCCPYHPAGVSCRLGQPAPCHAAPSPRSRELGLRIYFFFRGHLWVYFRYGPVTRSPSLKWLCQPASSALLSSANAAQAKGLLTFAPVGLPPILLNISTFSGRTAAQKFRSFEVDRYNGQPANNRLTLIDALLPEREPPVIVGLETAAEMNLVQIETNEFFPNSPLLNSRESSTTTQDRRCSHLSNPPFTQRFFPTSTRDGGRREPCEPHPCSLGERNVCRDLAAVGTLQQVQESPVRGSNAGAALVEMRNPLCQDSAHVFFA